MTPEEIAALGLVDQPGELVAETVDVEPEGVQAAPAPESSSAGR